MILAETILFLHNNIIIKETYCMVPYTNIYPHMYHTVRDDCHAFKFLFIYKDMEDPMYKSNSGVCMCMAIYHPFYWALDKGRNKNSKIISLHIHITYLIAVLLFSKKSYRHVHKYYRLITLSPTLLIPCNTTCN